LGPIFEFLASPTLLGRVGGVGVYEQAGGPDDPVSPAVGWQPDADVVGVLVRIEQSDDADREHHVRAAGVVHEHVVSAS
jgi:hypothetical protein